MKKRIIALMLALIMVLSLAACSSNDNGAADDGEKILHVAESFAYPSERLREPSSSLPMVRHI